MVLTALTARLGTTAESFVRDHPGGSLGAAGAAERAAAAGEDRIQLFHNPRCSKSRRALVRPPLRL